MKKLLILFSIVALTFSCGGDEKNDEKNDEKKTGPSMCDCVNESMKGEISEACKKMEEKMMTLEGAELEAKMKEAEDCAKALMDNNSEYGGENEYEDESEYEDELVDSDDSGSSEFDEAMDEYEAFIDDYIVMLKKAMDLQKDPEAMMNDPMAAMTLMEDAQKLMKEAESASEKLQAAADDFTSDQAERYMRLVKKLSEAATSMY